MQNRIFKIRFLTWFDAIWRNPTQSDAIRRTPTRFFPFFRISPWLQINLAKLKRTWEIQCSFGANLVIQHYERSWKRVVHSELRRTICWIFWIRWTNSSLTTLDMTLKRMNLRRKWEIFCSKNSRKIWSIITTYKPQGVPTSFRQDFGKKLLNVMKRKKNRGSLFTF